MGRAEIMVNQEVVTEPIVTFSGDAVTALETFLNECRWRDRGASAYCLLVDMHNETRQALGMEPMPVHPDSQSEYDAYRAAQSSL